MTGGAWKSQRWPIGFDVAARIQIEKTAAVVQIVLELRLIGFDVAVPALFRCGSLLPQPSRTLGQGTSLPVHLGTVCTSAVLSQPV
eukprot:3745471-Rhodomonas_salina.5